MYFVDPGYVGGFMNPKGLMMDGCNSPEVKH